MGRKCKSCRVGEEKLNNQGCLMKIIEYNASKDVVVEFQDEYKTIIKSQYHHFDDGTIQNPYYPTIYGVGILGNKYNTMLPNGRRTKEYETWRNIIWRSFDKKYKEWKPTYQDVTCCEEWLLFENFYEWLHSQENFDKWMLLRNKGAIDKDILIKGNKLYSPETCCLVSQKVNSLFIKDNACRGDLPIGVRYAYGCKNKYLSQCHDFYTGKTKHIGTFDTIEEAFYAYKNYKESCIKQVAQEEYAKGNITKQCYDAMMNYKVEITD